MHLQPPVLKRMSRQLSAWEQSSDPRAVFLGCYTLMTQNMLGAIQAGEFHDPEWVGELLEHFAGYYFTALDQYDNPNHTAPAVWQLTFDSARQPGMHVLQNLLLGVNAHINYDLILALGDMLEPDWERLDPAGRELRRTDHDHVNRIIGRTLDAVQDTILERQAPEMELVDRLLGPFDEWLISSLVERWRDQVWGDAVNRIERTAEKERELLRVEFENECLRRAKLFLLDDFSHLLHV